MVNKQRLILAIIVLASPWFWKIFLHKPFIGILLIITTLTSLVSTRIFIFFLSFLIVIQIFTTDIKLPWELNIYEYQLQQQRLREYSPITWIPIAHWLEQRKETVAFYKLQKNLFEVIDINNYFFSSYPRPSFISGEFEKFPYIFLPFFIIGVYFFYQKNKGLFVVSLLLPLIITTIGHNNLGSFSLFPFICLSIFWAVDAIKLNKFFIGAGIGLLSLVSIQLIAYAKF